MNRQIFILTTLFLVFLFGNNETSHGQTPSDPVVFISELKIVEAKVDDAIDLLSELQLETLDKEEGCAIYDVMLSDEDATKVFIYESYESEMAYNKHLKSKHYTDLFVKKIKPMLKESKTTKVFLLNFEGGYSDAEI